MGIKKLNKFLIDKNLSITYNSIGEFIKTKKITYKTNGNIVIAIDALLYMYKYSISYDYFIVGIWNQISFLLAHRIIPLYVIDGKYPEEKEQFVNSRNKKKYVLEQRLNNIRNQLSLVKKEEFCENNIVDFLNKEITKLEHRIIKINRNDIDVLKDFLTKINVPFIESKSEADSLCGYLYKNKYIVSCLSEDTDLLCHQCGSVIKFNNNKIIEYNLNFILKNLEVNVDQFIEMCILFGCDYLKPNFKMDTFDIFYNIKKHGSFSNILKNNIYTQFNNKKTHYFLKEFINVFLLYKNNNKSQNYAITMPSIEKNIDANILVEFIEEFRINKLDNDCKENIYKCVKYINNHINNKFLSNDELFRYNSN